MEEGDNLLGAELACTSGLHTDPEPHLLPPTQPIPPDSPKSPRLVLEATLQHQDL